MAMNAGPLSFCFLSIVVSGYCHEDALHPAYLLKHNGVVILSYTIIDHLIAATLSPVTSYVVLPGITEASVTNGAHEGVLDASGFDLLRAVCDRLTMAW